MTTTEHDYAAQARQAIEIVCAGDLSRMEEFYHPDFVDRINDMTFHGYDGGRESVAFYMAIFKNLRMGADEQITEGNRVASRWVLNGTYHGRPVTLHGITISHFAEDGRILEDRGHSDSTSLVRQLGVIRTLVLGLEILTRRVKLPKGALGGG
ncbi:MAG TPA: nuclear transport factor 2 family protein [Solirubrobacteraceae bacterium]|nr:nuclear transport factor 2 family protein [Solirubrobacteraceae bacterium]